MTHLTASTSREAYKTLDASSLYALILGHMEKHPEPWCIADLADALNLERSTVSARMNELKHLGEIVYMGKKKSRKTGINAMHWQKKRDTLF